jgi:hypothetical protein
MNKSKNNLWYKMIFKYKLSWFKCVRDKNKSNRNKKDKKDKNKLNTYKNRLQFVL